MFATSTDDRLGTFALETARLGSRRFIDAVVPCLGRTLGARCVVLATLQADGTWKIPAHWDGSRLGGGEIVPLDAMNSSSQRSSPEAFDPARAREVPNGLREAAAQATRRHVVPLRNDSGDLLGLLDVRHDEPFTPEDEELIRFAAARTVAAIEELRAADASATSASRFRAIVDAAVDGIVIIDAAGIVEFFNHSAEKLFGYAAEEVIGRNVGMLAAEPHCRRHDEYLARYCSTGESRVVGIGREVEGRRKDGRLFPMALSLSEVVVDGKRTFTAIVRDLTERHRAEAELQALSEQMAELAHESGMATVATGVLHDVGNALNSITVAASVAAEKLIRSEASSLSRALELLDEHWDDLPGYAATSPQGRHLRAYLRDAAAHMLREQSELQGELTALTRRVEHVKTIVSAQQTHARSCLFVDSVSVPELIEEALEIGEVPWAEPHVTVVRRYADLPPIRTDKQKLLQILVNLVRNGVQAMHGVAASRRRLTVEFEACGDDRARIRVADDGVGIPAENLSRIFSHGFTTKPAGHGFGLHASALAAEELGGALSAASDGPDRGAVFTLELPLRPVSKDRTT